MRKLARALRARLRRLADRLLDEHDKATPDLRWNEEDKKWARSAGPRYARSSQPSP